MLVQPSFYGADNTLLLEGLDILGAHGRGVAVIDPAVTAEGTLKMYAQRGVRGLRLNLYSTAAGRGLRRIDNAFAAIANRARLVDWHVEVIAAAGVLAANAEALSRSPAPVVIDHYGLHGAARPQSGEGRGLLDLLRLPHVWIKLSAPYRVTGDTLATQPDRDWLAAILTCAADRCVWGSDWPHTPLHELQTDGAVELPYRTLSYDALVDDFVAAVGSAELAERIMVDNPTRLYGFGTSA